jgi:hypothetical protein
VTRKSTNKAPRQNVISKNGVRFVLATFVIMSFMVLSFSSSANYQPNTRSNVKTETGSTGVAPAALGANLFSRIISAFLAPTPAPPKADLDQVRNGTAAEPIDPPNWVNGNAGASNAHYQEGQSIPYRIRLSNISTSTHTLDIEYDIKHSGANAIDYITHYDRIGENVLPCLGVAGCDPNSFSTFAVPTPSSAGTPVDNQPVTSFNLLPAEQKVMTIYNGTITSLTYISQGDLNAAQSSTSMRITFTADSPTVVIAWGGHIASAGDWGPGNSAGGVSGSPYHTRLIAFDGSGGNQDRSLSAAAVQPPAGCTVTGDDTVCAASTQNYSVPLDPALTYLWTITGNGSIVGSNTGNSVQVLAGASGSYTVTVVQSNAGGSTTCSLTATISTPSVSISVGTECSPALTATAGFSSYLWSGPSNNGATTQSITPTAPGVYTVTVTNAEGCQASASGTVCFTFTAN